MPPCKLQKALPYLDRSAIPTANPPLEAGDCFINLSPDDIGALEIRTQVDVQRGRPDLEICTPHRLAWVEVKVESAVRAGQLEGYRVLMAECGYVDTRLILLSRYPEDYAATTARPDVAIRWFEIAEWLEAEISWIQSTSETGGFLSRQFFDFLKERNMTLTQVSKYMPEGTRALSSLLNMLKEAAGSCKVSANLSAGWDYLGLKLDGGKYWVGVMYEEPEKLWFETLVRIDLEAARRIGVGEVYEGSWVPGRNIWYRGIELDSEEVHFFSHSKIGQMQCLEEFLRESLGMARTMEVPGQPPTLEGEEND